jgi:hypothetical protein
MGDWLALVTWVTCMSLLLQVLKAEQGVGRGECARSSSAPPAGGILVSLCTALFLMHGSKCTSTERAVRQASNGTGCSR